MIVEALHALTLALYLVAAGMLAASFAEARPLAPRTGVALVAVGLLTHTLGLAGWTIRHGELPLTGLGPALSTLALLIGACALAAMIARDARPLGLVLAPLLTLLLGIALVQGLEPAPAPLAFRGVWFGSHVVLSLAAPALLAVAFAAGLLYLLQFRALKGKRFGRVFRYFPSLELLDRAGRLAVGLGFGALTAGLVLGWAWTLRYRGTLAVGEPQVIWGIATWLTFLAVLLVRRGPGRDRKGALASVLGFALVVLLFVVLRLSMTGGRTFL